MYKEDLALNNLQWLICHKPKSISKPILMHTNTHHVYIIYIYI